MTVSELRLWEIQRSCQVWRFFLDNFEIILNYFEFSWIFNDLEIWIEIILIDNLCSVSKVFLWSFHFLWIDIICKFPRFPFRNKNSTKTRNLFPPSIFRISSSAHALIHLFFITEGSRFFESWDRETFNKVFEWILGWFRVLFFCIFSCAYRLSPTSTWTQLWRVLLSLSSPRMKFC